MSQLISVMDKKVFIYNFLRQFEVKQRESKWLLTYLLEDDHLMESVHFVEKSECTPRALLISTKGVEGTPFSFRKNGTVTTNWDTAFHDIRLNDEEELFIELHFPGASEYKPYLAILEDNPYLPEYEQFKVVFRKEAERLLEHTLLQFSREKLTMEIDDALMKGDRERFHLLVNELNALKE